jgi:BBSome-interacting protein 1
VFFNVSELIQFSKMTKSIEEVKAQLKEILPKTGLVYSERGGLSEILCKPKIMPLKSTVLEQLQKLEEKLVSGNNNDIDGEGEDADKGALSSENSTSVENEKEDVIYRDEGKSAEVEKIRK